MKLIGIAPKRAGLALVVLATGCAVTACGSSSSSSSTTSASASTSTTSSGGRFNSTAFRTCMQQHGVTLPNRRPGGTGGGPPGGGGGGAGGFFGGGGGGQFSNPKFQAALKACGGSFPGRGGAGRGGRVQPSHTAVNNFVACVRKNGYPQMPNANFSGTGPVFPSSIRSNSKFQTASRACQSLLVPSRRAGTSTTTGA